MSVRKFVAGRFVAVALVAVVLAGCSQTAPEIDADAASRMQASVAAVTQAAAVGDAEGALIALEALEAQLKLDTESGAISAERSAQIQASIDLVRADLIAALPAPSPTPTPTSDEKDNKGKDEDDDKGKKGDKDD
ncbi:MAG: hypothetical protein ACOH1M_01100 [Rhodoglobus sp.]